MENRTEIRILNCLATDRHRRIKDNDRDVIATAVGDHRDWGERSVDELISNGHGARMGAASAGANLREVDGLDHEKVYGVGLRASVSRVGSNHVECIAVGERKIRGRNGGSELPAAN